MDLFYRMEWPCHSVIFSIGCLACQKTGHCVIKDDVADIMNSVLKADVVVWATPIYCYEMTVVKT